MERVNDRLLNWASDIEEGTLEQAKRTARLPIIAGHVALMPDAHFGTGATVGSVIPTENAIIPAAVGVDIGCGMIATRTTLTASQLPDDLDPLLPLIEEAVPAGVGKGHTISSRTADQWMSKHRPNTILSSEQTTTALRQFGSLGSGNHFAEVCLDEADTVWLVLHSGSRGIGNQLANSHIKVARKHAKLVNMPLEDPDLAYFEQGSSYFNAYIADMLWAQDYALANREAMMTAAIKTFFGFVGSGQVAQTINCHHNFTVPEQWPDADGNLRQLWITRKGAIQADVGDLGVIPGSMGTRSYIVEGLGNPLSWNSCSHGAGRRMGRKEAKRQFTVEDLAEQMKGKTWLSDRAASLLDEIPSSYKDIDVVMADQTDLVRVVHELHQVLNYKGA